MGKGLRAQVTNGQDGSSFERTFEDFPVRIGRDPLNELPVDFPFVSKFHAVVDLRGDTLVLRDLGSRNGTSLQTLTERIPPNEPVDLATSQFTFRIGALQFVVAVVEVERTSSARLVRKGAILSHLPELDDAAPESVGEAGMQRRVEGLQADLDAWRLAWGKLYANLSTALGSMPADERARFLDALASEHPTLDNEADFRRLAEHVGARRGVPTSTAGGAASAGTREEATALLVLRDLASWYVDANRLPQTVPQLVAFGRKIQDVLDALFVSFVPLREGLRKFSSEFDVPVGGAITSAPRPADAATNPAELAARLLDWNDTSDSGRIVRRVFTDLMVHNVGLVSGVMRGASALLEQLAPATLEAELDVDRQQGKTGFAVGPWRFRALWDVLKRRHGDLASEEQERFALVFGEDFARAYTSLTAGARLSKTPEAPARPAGSKPPDREATPAVTRGASAPPPRIGPTGTAVVHDDANGAGPRRGP